MTNGPNCRAGENEAPWGVYPVAYLLPLLNVGGADAWVFKQVGYSVADIVAKAVYGLIIFQVAKVKSYDDDSTFATTEMSREDIPAIRT
jgi:hypothetical protein